MLIINIMFIFFNLSDTSFLFSLNQNNTFVQLKKINTDQKIDYARKKTMDVYSDLYMFYNDPELKCKHAGQHNQWLQKYFSWSEVLQQECEELNKSLVIWEHLSEGAVRTRPKRIRNFT